MSAVTPETFNFFFFFFILLLIGLLVISSTKFNNIVGKNKKSRRFINLAILFLLFIYHDVCSIDRKEISKSF